MRIRNLQAFDFWFPYAGKDKKGYHVKANKLSPRLPSDRFYDPALQRDWKKGRIDVLLDEADEAVLGAEVANCVTTEVVKVEGDKEVGAQSVPVQEQTPPVTPPEEPIVPVQEQPAPIPAAPPEPLPEEPSETSSESMQESIQIPSQGPVAKFEEDPVPQQVTTPVVRQESSQASMQEQPSETAPELPPEVAPSPVEPPQEIDGELHCTGCGRAGKKASVKIEEATQTPLCKYCRGARTRTHKEPPVQTEPMAPVQPPAAKEGPPVPVPMPIPEGAEDPADKPLDPPKVPGIPHTPGSMPSLSDLQETNRRIQLGTPAVTQQPGVPIATVEVPDKRGPAPVQGPAPVPAAGNVEGITAFMGDMSRNGTPPKI